MPRLAPIASMLLAASCAHNPMHVEIARADRDYADGYHSDAAAAYDRVIERYGARVPAHTFARRAAIYVDSGSWDEGLRWIDEVARRHHPEDPGIARQHAFLLWGAGRRDQAVAVAARVVAKHPNDADMHRLTGDHAFDTGATQRAISAYGEYLRARPDGRNEVDKAVRMKLGLAELAMGELDAAEQNLAHALTLEGDPRLDYNAHKGLCAVYGEKRQWRDAIDMCELAMREELERGTTEPELRFQAGRAYLQLDQLVDARRLLRDYVERAPDRAIALYLLGDAYAREADCQTAVTYWTRALQVVRPKDPEAPTIREAIEICKARLKRR